VDRAGEADAQMEQDTHLKALIAGAVSHMVSGSRVPRASARMPPSSWLFTFSYRYL
jgi:hypothetical protein